MRATAYLRASTREQKLSLDAQREAIERWATREGATVVSWHADEGVSGSVAVDKREGLLSALAALKAEPGGVIIVAKRDRLARSVLVAAIAERLAEKAGGRILSADGIGADDSPEGTLMRTILDAFSEYERALIRARTRAALRAKKAAGGSIGHDAPYGYRHHEGAIVPDEDEQPTLARILSRHESGQTAYRIAKDLQAEGVPSRGGRWHTNTVRRILKRHGERTGV